MSYVYCPITRAFITILLRQTIVPPAPPDDYVKVVDEDYDSLMAGQTEGKVIVSDKNGYPVLAEPPAPTHESCCSGEFSKTSLMQAANDIITPLEDASELGIATEEEAAALLRWKRYRVMLNRVDVTTAPDIEWPERPA